MGVPRPRAVYQKPCDSADLIIVGRIVRVQQTGEGEVTFHEHSYTRRDFLVEIRVDHTIIGSPVSSKFIFSYSTPAQDSSGNVGDGGLSANTYRIVFLKETPAGYALANPCAASLPASSASCGPKWRVGLEQDAYNKVLRRVVDVLCTTSDLEEKRLALTSLNGRENSSAAPFLKAVLSLPDVQADATLRTGILCDLLTWKDLTVLSLVEKDLFRPSSHTAGHLKSNLLLAASSLDPKISVPLLARALKLPESDARVGAARFLEYTHSDAALDGLLTALDDPDRGVQFAVMQSLGNTTNQHQWRPHDTEIGAPWDACIQHWQEFGRQRRRAFSRPSAN